MAVAAMDMVSRGIFKGKFSRRETSAWRRPGTSQENQHCLAPRLKVRPLDGTVLEECKGRPVDRRNFLPAHESAQPAQGES
jgi:hypothetical protein